MKVYITLFFLLVSKSGFDSLTKRHIDSLKPLANYTLVGNNQKDFLNIDRLNELAAKYFESNPDSTLFYGQLSVQLSRKIGYKPGLANGLLQVAHANYFKGSFKLATQEFDESITLFKGLNNKKGLGECYELYGKMLNLQANYKLALTYLNLALEINKQQKNESAIARCYKNIGMVNFGRGQLPVALDFYYKALFIDIKENDKRDVADIYNNIGDALQNMEAYPKALDYYKKALNEAQQARNLLEIGTANENIGEVLLAQKKYDDAIVYLSKSMQIATKQQDKDGISYISADLGLCYAYKNRMTEATKLLDTSLKVATQNKIVYNEAYALISYATVFNLQKDYKNAGKYAIRGQALATRLGNVWFRANATLQLYKSFAGLGKFEDAFKYSVEYSSLKDSLKSSEGIQKLTSYTLTLNFKAKQQQIELQQKAKDALYNQKIRQQKLNAVFGFIIGIMILVLFSYYAEKRRQQKTILMLADKNAEILQQKTNIDEQAQKLSGSNLLKDRLISILAHDLRAPLSTLRGVFALLQDDTISIDEVLQMIPSVLKKLEYTSDFLDTLLFWINSQVEHAGESVKTFCLKDIVASETVNLYDQANAKGIRLINNVRIETYACADPDSIRIVLRNLVTNALKFSRKNDVVELSSRLEADPQTNSDYIVITVTDSGIGMTASQAERLFNGRVNSETGTQNESGTGMGIMFCKDLIERYGGEIWVTSKQGEGSAFSFTVPAAASIVTERTLVMVS